MSADIEKRIGSEVDLVPQIEVPPSDNVSVDAASLLVPETEEDAEAIEILQKKGILPVVFEVVEAISPERHPAIDVGRRKYSNGNTRTVTATRWAPQTSPEEKLVSKAARVELFPNDRGLPRVHYAHFRHGSKGVEINWKPPDPLSGEIDAMPLDRKLVVAMSSATVKIEDNRKLVNGVYVGRPGVGSVE